MRKNLGLLVVAFCLTATAQNSSTAERKPKSGCVLSVASSSRSSHRFLPKREIMNSPIWLRGFYEDEYRKGVR
jgi:hypothetical protein